MHPVPRPDGFTWCCTVLVAAPAIVVLVAAVGLILTAPQELAGPALLGVTLGLLGSPVLLALD